MNTTKFGFLKAFLAVAIAILLMAAGAFFFWMYQQKTAKTVNPVNSVQLIATPIPSVTKANTPPTPTIAEITLTPTVAVSPTPQVSDLDLIKAAMAAKHGKAVGDVNLTISKNTGTHATGGVDFAGEVGGGWWLAAKSGGAWVIVQDGNGTMDCAVIAPYNFPNTIVSECWDAATQNLVVR